MNTHRALSDDRSRRLDAALVLLLANHVADPDALRHCLQAAREAIRKENA